MFDAAFRLHQDPHEWVEHPSDLQSIDPGTSENLRRYAAQCKIETRKARQSGDKDWSAALMERAKLLKELLDANGAERSEHLSNFVGECFDKMPLLHWRAIQGDSIARDGLEMITKDCAIRLVHMAKGGSPEAVHLLAQLAHSFTKVINEIGTNKPELVAQIAQTLTSWPVLDSPHPKMGGIKPNYERIMLGAALPIRIEPGAQLPHDDRVGRVAWPLLLHVVRVRRRQVALAIKAGEFCDRCEQSLQPQSSAQPLAVCKVCGFRLLPDEGKPKSSGASFGQCHLCDKTRLPGKPKGASPFLPGDFIDVPRLVCRLGKPTDAVSIYLSDQISGQVGSRSAAFLALRIQSEQIVDKEAEQGWELDPDLTALVEEFNKCMRSSSIFSVARFCGVTMSPETRKLVSENPQGVALRRLNRLLLEDAYPQHLSRSKTVQKCPLCENRILNNDQRIEKLSRLPLLDRATLLPEFHPSTVRMWWSFAEGCLVAGYPHPDKEMIGELDETVAILDEILTARSHRTDPTTKRRRIREKLEKRFSDFATGSRFERKRPKEKAKKKPDPTPSS